MDLSEVTYGWIHNTLELERLALSENLRGAVEGNPLIEIEEGPTSNSTGKAI